MITIYSKSNCTQCIQAAAMLRAKGKLFKELKLDKDYDIEYLKELCESVGKPMPRSFPVLFVEETSEYIGDLQELKMKLSQGLV